MKNKNLKDSEKNLDESCCIDCEACLVFPNPDPDDWFNDDDVAVVCKQVKNVSDRSKFKLITQACRPYNIRKECTPIPEWCPK